MNISAIIPTYNNTKQLIQNLKHNIPFLKECEVIIVNDHPQQSIAGELDQFPEITLIENKKNLGFSGTMNTGVKKATNEYVMFLNDDVVLNDQSYTKGLKHFEEDTNLFAVSFAQKEKNGEIVGKNKIFWKNGFLQHSLSGDLHLGITGWAEGGSALFDKKKFNTIGGFDTIYAPFYWEDIDLSYRAWKKGYTILFDPEIRVEHHHESTIGNHFSKSRITSIAYRNQLIFIWKNITSLSLILQHKLFLLKMLLQAIIKGDKNFLNGFTWALARTPQILPKRSTISPVRTDHEILNLFSE